jgi:hypothetical protein
MCVCACESVFGHSYSASNVCECVCVCVDAYACLYTYCTTLHTHACSHSLATQHTIPHSTPQDKDSKQKEQFFVVVDGSTGVKHQFTRSDVKEVGGVCLCVG